MAENDQEIEQKETANFFDDEKLQSIDSEEPTIETEVVEEKTDTVTTEDAVEETTSTEETTEETTSTTDNTENDANPFSVFGDYDAESFDAHYKELNSSVSERDEKIKELTTQLESREELSDFQKELLEAAKDETNLFRLLENKRLDPENMSTEELLRLKLERDNPGAKKEYLDLLFEDSVTDVLSAERDEDMEDREARKLQLKKEQIKNVAEQFRRKLGEEKASFKVPEVETKDTLADYQQKEAETLANFGKSVDEHPFIKQLGSEKQLSFKVDDQNTFKYEVDPVKVAETIKNPQAFWEHAVYADEKGNKQMNVDMAADLAAFSLNPEQYKRSLIEYGKSLQNEELSSELKNESVKKDATTTETMSDTEKMVQGAKSFFED